MPVILSLRPIQIADVSTLLSFAELAFSPYGNQPAAPQDTYSTHDVCDINISKVLVQHGIVTPLTADPTIAPLFRSDVSTQELP